MTSPERSGRPAAPRAPALLLLAAVIAMALTLGCGREGEAVPLDAWDLVVESGTPQPLALPAHFDNRMAKAPQTYHLTTRVHVPEPLRGAPLTLVIPHFWANVSLSVGGDPMASLVADPGSSYRTRGDHAFSVPREQTQASELALDLTVRHQWVQSAWLDAIPYLTSAPDGGTRYAALRAITVYGNFAGGGSVLTVAFVYGVLFALDRRRKAHGWLALQAATASSYCLFGAGTAEDIFGHYDAVVMLVLMVIAIYGSIQFTRAQFKLPPANRAWVVLLLVALLAAAGFSGPFAASDVTGPVAVSIIALGVGSQIWTLFPLALRADAPTNARVMLLAWIMLAVINGPDLMAWGGIWDPLGGFRAGSIGIACFGLLQAVVLMRDFMASLRRADRLNEVLQGKIENLAQQTSTVAHLNEELGRQVLARSEQLSDALMRLATAQGEPALLKEHEIVEGRYDVVRVVGSGGMGVVYEVRRLSDGARLAMKILSGAVGVREMARFAREAKLAATVHHENVVRIFDVAVSRVGFLFLVLEFVDGAPLSRTRERYGNVGWVLRVLHGVARGLEAIHAEDIVHRDLKPANVLVRHDASGMPVDVKITDFGISNSSATSSGTAPAQTSSTPPPPHQGARSGDDGYRPAEDESRTMDLPASAPSAPDREPGPLTQTGTVLGTPLYMAPELLRDPPSAATPSDIYSFGVLAFELVHGRRPFSEPEAMGRAFGYFHAELPPMEPRGVPAPLAALFTAALALNPRARPTAAALVTALSRALVDSQPPVARGPFATDEAT